MLKQAKSAALQSLFYINLSNDFMMCQMSTEWSQIWFKIPTYDYITCGSIKSNQSAEKLATDNLLEQVQIHSTIA